MGKAKIRAGIAEAQDELGVVKGDIARFSRTNKVINLTLLSLLDVRQDDLEIEIAVLRARLNEA